MLSAYQLPISSNPSADFLEALSVNEASDNVDLVLPLRESFWFIRAITIVSKQDLSYELMLFAKADNNVDSIADDSFNGVWQFGPLVVGPPASPGWPFEGPDLSPQAEFYRFYVDGNMMPYFDADQLAAASQASGGTFPNNAKIHCRLINRSATPKLAGANGALKVTFFTALQGQQV